jgi:thiosulfate/3-mercaptopyruvate sulfurtransferase
VHSDYDKAGWRVTRNNVPFMVPTVPELEKLIGDLGIDEDTHVVVVPAGVNVLDFGSAARTYWTLKYVGVKNVSILDGGVAAWRSAGLPVETGTKAPSPKIFTATVDRSILAEAADVESIEGKGGATLIDARPVSFCLGKEKAPASKAYGHIPGALNIDSAEFYDAKSNRLKPKAELAAIANAVQGPVVNYCNTGHWASTDWFVFHEILGRKDAKLYAGSMVEWTSNDNRPIESSRTKWDDLKKAFGLGSLSTFRSSNDNGKLGRVRSGRGRSYRPPFLRARTGGDGDLGRAGASRPPARFGGFDYRWLRSRSCIPQG